MAYPTPEQNREYQKRYRERNKERAREYQERYRNEDKELHLAYHRAWYWKNRLKISDRYYEKKNKF
jgi:hypothetical protein